MSELIARLPNARLLVRVRELIRSGNTVEAELLEHLGEVDARRLYLGLAPRWRTLHLRLAERRRCNSKDFVEFDHADAWTRSRSHPLERILLRCRAHNQQRARLDFGEEHMARFGRNPGGPSTGFESSCHPVL